jgi:hypothetical protein
MGLICKYFCDIAGEPEEEARQIRQKLEDNGFKKIKIKVEKKPDCIEERNYDVLFFDWGGMSIGNSMLEHFCGRILTQAEERPNTYFVMTSLFTESAMFDAKESFGKELANLFLNIDDFVAFLKKMKVRHGGA